MRDHSVHYNGLGTITFVSVPESQRLLICCTSCGKSGETMGRLNGSSYYCNVNCAIGRCFGSGQPNPVIVSRTTILGGKIAKMEGSR